MGVALPRLGGLVGFGDAPLCEPVCDAADFQADLRKSEAI
jgi:hypothetical protein